MIFVWVCSICVEENLFSHWLLWPNVSYPDDTFCFQDWPLRLKQFCCVLAILHSTYTRLWSHCCDFWIVAAGLWRAERWQSAASWSDRGTVTLADKLISHRDSAWITAFNQTASLRVYSLRQHEDNCGFRGMFERLSKVQVSDDNQPCHPVGVIYWLQRKVSL